MTIYSIAYISTTLLEEDVENGFSISVCNSSSVEEVQNEIKEIIEEFFPEFFGKIDEAAICYAAFAGEPSWMGLADEEYLFLNLQIEEINR